MTHQVYDPTEAAKASLEYFQGDELASSVWLGKYALRDKQGQLLESTPVQMHRRLAKEFARIEAKYKNPMSEDEIFGLFDRFKYVVPQGSPMSAIGNPHKTQSLSNCFVIEGPYDSYASILRADHQQVEIMKRRGGVGFDLSRIRPRGMLTANAAGTTDGIGVFMDRYSNSCREVAQGGRRGALMLTIDIRHPEIETFINIKRDKKRVTGANISIRLTDAFMQAVQDDEDFTLQWPVDAKTPKIERVVKAKKIWEQIVDSAWESAEPGILFWDTVKKWTPADAYESVGYGSCSTNPCAELILPPYDSCRLLLVNSYSYVANPFTPKAEFNWELFSEHVQKAQRLMDDLVDLEIEAVDKIIAKVKSDPEPDDEKAPELKLWQKIREVASNARRTGLGLTGLGDALAAMNIKYGSKQSIERIEEIYRALAVNAHASSVQMAKERGAFPVSNAALEKGHPFFERINQASEKHVQAMYRKFGRRNICLTTTAPAGSVSVLTQTTSGIEPAFMLSYKRRKKINPNDAVTKVDFTDDLGDKWQEYTVYHHAFKKWMEVSGKTDPKHSPYHNATANDIDWVASVELQAGAQKWTEHAISKTCNLPSTATKEMVSQVYMKAWTSGCKGFTIYRDGSRSGVLVAETPGEKKPETNPQHIVETHAPKRPKELPCDIHQVKIAGDSWTVLVGLYGGKPYEIFGGLSSFIEIPKKWKAGKLHKNGRKDGVTTYNLSYGNEDDVTRIKDVLAIFDNPTHGALTRTISLALRHGVPLQFTVEQLAKDKHSDMQSFSKVMSRVLKTYVKDGTKSGDRTCPSCGASDSLKYQEGCVACANCSYSKCS